MTTVAASRSNSAGSEPLLLALGDCRDLRLAGGKALNLARLLAAGLPVPDGFVVTVAAYEQERRSGGLSDALAGEITAWYRRLGAPSVAVRSSATAEDLEQASMAGQYQTILDVQGADALLAAIRHCWASVDSDRTRAYLAEHGLDPAAVAMAVVVQRLVPADVAGVLFTANPRTGSRAEMLLEASWGLGEAVVAGTVQPDTLVLDRHDGRVLSATIGDKHVRLVPGQRAPTATPPAQRSVACLTSRQVQALWQLGVRVAEHFGTPQDLEWALHDGQFYLLQSRPITTLAAAESSARCLEQVRTELRAARRAGRGEWVRHNLAETLPHPTPFTWSVMRRFMSGAGGFGAMYRMAGFEPSPQAQQEGVLDLIAGRLYLDLSRAPEMFLAGFPYRYDVELLRTSPDAAQGPPTVPAGSAWQQYRSSRRLAAIQRRLTELAGDGDRRFDENLLPAFAQYVAAERQRDLTQLDPAAWIELWQQRERQVLDEFAPQSLLPNLIAVMAVTQLRTTLDELCWDEDPGGLTNLLAVASAPDQTVKANQGLYEVALGQRALGDWLAEYGHRAPEEFELASPRWREQPAAVESLAARLQDAPAPLAMHQRCTAEAAARLAKFTARLPRADRRELTERVRLAQRYLRFREDGKHALMLGYQLLRDLALEAGRRLDIGDDVFLLTLPEVQQSLTTGFAPLHVIDVRRQARAAEARLALGHAITDADIDTLGTAYPVPSDGRDPHAALPPLAAGGRLDAFPISAGVRQGSVRIVLAPQSAGDLGQGYVLVCPSTDPSWTPLFVNAAALVLECGGTLSHGAVVARELGIPAVVCPNATQMLAEGELVTVDGHHGALLRGGTETASAAAQAEKSDANDTRISRELIPPIPGRRERRSARLRNVMLLVWLTYLAAVFLLPVEWLYRPSLAVLDRLLWPLVAAWGKPAAVGMLAAGLAGLTILGQWLLTDTRRLRVAKHRAGRLGRLAGQLPPDSPRAAALLRLARPVQTRILAAALVPLAVVLGPMVMSFLWLPQRVDPAARNARPGATVYVVATVDGEFAAPLSLEVETPLRLDESTSAAQSLPPIRATLTERLSQWQESSDLSDLPWELQEAGRWIAQTLAEDLREYLSHSLPPQTLAWTVYTPQDQPGRFPVTLSAAGTKPVQAHLVLGDLYPPEPKEDLGDGKGPVQVVRPRDRQSPIRFVRLTYFDPQKEGPAKFWTPLAAVGFSGGDAGWLVTYMLAYLPAMFLLRWLLRLP
jgi:pyruvate,water dikinase